MRKAHLTREETGDQGTFGTLWTDKGFECRVLELPWRDEDADGLSDKGESCLPEGVYLFRWRADSPKHGECYEMLPSSLAPNRTNIQVHAANLAGDARLGYVKQLDGCIAPGAAVVTFKSGTRPAGDKDQRGVAASKATLRELEAHLGREPFELTICWAPGVGPGPGK